MYVITEPQGEGGEGGTKNIFEEILAETLNTQIQEAPKTKQKQKQKQNETK